MTRGNCFVCGSPDHFARECPKTADNVSQTSTGSGSRDNTWANGKPKIWCKYHQNWGAHESRDCRLQHRGTPCARPPPHGDDRDDGPFRQRIADVLLEVLPEKAGDIIGKVVQEGVKVEFPRDTTDKDAQDIRESIPVVRRIFRVGRSLVMPCKDADARDMIKKSLKGAHDSGIELAVTELTKSAAQTSGPQNFGTSTMNFSASGSTKNTSSSEPAQVATQAPAPVPASTHNSATGLYTNGNRRPFQWRAN